MSEKYYCVLLDKTIDKSLCIDVNCENEKIIEEAALRIIKEITSKTNEEIKNTCRKCSGYPFPL